MITGVVNSRLQGILTLLVRGPSGHILEFETVVDTGFSDYLTLPHEIVEELGLEFATTFQAVLADGSQETLPAYNITVMWGGESRQVRVLKTMGESLVGMRMLYDHSLQIDVVEGGRVLVEPR